MERNRQIINKQKMGRDKFGDANATERCGRSEWELPLCWVVGKVALNKDLEQEADS